MKPRELGKLTDVNIAELGEVLAELLNLGLVGLDLVALGIGALALLLNVEAEVLKENNFTVVGLVDNLLNLGTDAVGGEGDLLAEELLELRNNGLQGVLGVGLAVGTAKVRHEDNGLGAMVERILDGGDGTGDTLRVGDLLLGVKGDIEVDLEKGGMLELLSGSSIHLYESHSNTRS